MSIPILSYEFNLITCIELITRAFETSWCSTGGRE